MPLPAAPRVLGCQHRHSVLLRHCRLRTAAVPLSNGPRNLDSPPAASSEPKHMYLLQPRRLGRCFRLVLLWRRWRLVLLWRRWRRLLLSGAGCCRSCLCHDLGGDLPCSCNHCLVAGEGRSAACCSSSLSPPFSLPRLLPDSGAVSPAIGSASAMGVSSASPAAAPASPAGCAACCCSGGACGWCSCCCGRSWHPGCCSCR